MMYGIEVHVRTHDAHGAVKWEWRRMHPTGGAPYVWASHAEADRAGLSAYGMGWGNRDNWRVVELNQE